jgi:GDP-L-fucose synthase
LAKDYGREYVSVMSTNLYGPNYNFELATSDVLPAPIRKAHKAPAASRRRDGGLGHAGTPRREFAHVDHLVDAYVHLMERGYAGPLMNIGWSEDLSIRELAD